MRSTEPSTSDAGTRRSARHASPGSSLITHAPFGRARICVTTAASSPRGRGPHDVVQVDRPPRHEEDQRDGEPAQRRRPQRDEQRERQRDRGDVRAPHVLLEHEEHEERDEPGEHDPHIVR